jgi:cyclopropane fatty-acyl-phospholipid synthase-like methyltransferase
MLYSCAYFQTGEEELDTAQTAKLEHICRKLRLQPGDRLLDIGCGWGGLIAYAAQHYGVDATGITLSQPQADLANGRIAEAGLADSCRVVLLDYRDLEARREEAVTQVGERMYRVWRLYMAGCSHSFDNARLSVHQSLLSKPDGEGRSQQPMTRAHIYA